MAEFGEKLRKAREEKGMTQQSLAEKIYVTRQTVSRWECGDRYPDLITLKKVASLLDVSIDELLSDDEVVQVVEKVNVVENLVMNNLKVALFAIVVLVFGIQAVRIFVSYPDVWMAIKQGEGYQIFTAIKDLAEAVLFAFGFVYALKGTATPKRTGVIMTGFFGLELLARFTSMVTFSHGFEAMIAYLVPMIIYLIGCIGAVRFLVIGKNHIIYQIFIYIACGFEIAVPGYNILNFLCTNNSGMLIAYGLTAFLRLLICVIFIYITVILGHKRKNAKDISEKN